MTAEKPTYAFEGFTLDAQRRVLSRTGGEPILLAPKALDTLLYNVQRQAPTAVMTIFPELTELFQIKDPCTSSVQDCNR